MANPGRTMVLIGQVFDAKHASASIFGIRVTDKAISGGCRLEIRSPDGKHTINATVGSIEIRRQRTNVCLPEQDCAVMVGRKPSIQPKTGWEVYARADQAERAAQLTQGFTPRPDKGKGRPERTVWH
ncbi:hypothetical protein KKF61_04100 [Patescibacteria group bacterium]|nr:hypothetical protein [Patescibacteria group bacterium]